MTTKWEYGDLYNTSGTYWSFSGSTSAGQTRNATEALNALGCEGWEAYGAILLPNQVEMKYLMKRPVAE